MSGEVRHSKGARRTAAKGVAWFDMSAPRVWLVREDESVARTYLVSGASTATWMPGATRCTPSPSHGCIRQARPDAWSTGNTGISGRFYAKVKRTPYCRPDTSPTIRAVR